MRVKSFAACLLLKLVTIAPLCHAQDTVNAQQVQEHLQKAQQFLQARQPDLAIPELQSVVALDPNNLGARTNLGVLLFFKGDYTAATPQLRAALQLQPDMWKTQALLGISERRIGDTVTARTDLESAFPHLSEDKIRNEAGLELVEIESNTGDLVKAGEVVSQLREHDPTNMAVLYAAYRIYSDLAGEAILSMSLTDPNSAQMHQAMAHELEKQGDKAGAIAQYRQAVKINPALPGLHFELAEVLNASGEVANKDEAEREYHAALLVNTHDEKAECRLGELAAQRGDVKESFTHYQHAYQLQPQDPDAAVGLAKAYTSMDQPDKALPLLEQVVEHDPANAIAHFRLSTLYRQTGRTADAKRDVEEYKKYKAMKEKLGDLYKQMRLQPGKEQSDEADEPK